MQPSQWQPPVALSEQEKQIIERIRRARLFVFLRRYRHDLFDESVQQELATLYRPSKRGTHPLLLHNWPWRSFYQRTRVCPMTR